MISKIIIIFIILIGSTGVLTSTYAEPQVSIIMEKTTYTYCERLVYSIEVSEIIIISIYLQFLPCRIILLNLLQ